LAPPRPALRFDDERFAPPRFAVLRFDRLLPPLLDVFLRVAMIVSLV
jgi:hypothetical protein